MDILTLRESLETLLADSLGVYELANGYRTPAVSVRAVGEAMTPGTKVTGMELILQRDPDLDPIRQYKRPQAFRVWTVYLVDWSGDVDLDAAAAQILEEYPSTTITAPSLPEGLGPSHQMRLEITTNPVPA